MQRKQASISIIHPENKLSKCLWLDSVIIIEFLLSMLMMMVMVDEFIASNPTQTHTHPVTNDILIRSH